eukprot:6212871-Pleurochrysis_carterae.AAC.3
MKDTNTQPFTRAIDERSCCPASSSMFLHGIRHHAPPGARAAARAALWAARRERPARARKMRDERGTPFTLPSSGIMDINSPPITGWSDTSVVSYSSLSMRIPSVYGRLHNAIVSARRARGRSTRRTAPTPMLALFLLLALRVASGDVCSDLAQTRQDARQLQPPKCTSQCDSVRPCPFWTSVIRKLGITLNARSHHLLCDRSKAGIAAKAAHAGTAHGSLGYID